MSSLRSFEFMLLNLSRVNSNSGNTPPEWYYCQTFNGYLNMSVSGASAIAVGDRFWAV